jgi:hypothetical protein
MDAVFDCALGRELTQEEVAARPPITVEPVFVTSVSPRQARLALLGAGLLDKVEAAIAAISDPTERVAALTEWDYALEFRRDNALLTTIGEGLKLSEEQIDALFVAAAAL